MNWQEAVQKAVELRHWFHLYPELTWEEENTARKIREIMDELQIPWRACADYGTVATLAADKKGKHIALRADMDALPICEDTTVAFSSTKEGKMHACGHDGHMAALLGTAFWLKANEEKLEGPVSLVFQPAEEGGHGAKKMVEDGALDGVDQIYGWHNWPAMPFGTAVCPDGPVMSGNGRFLIEVEGVGGHASQPEVCRDPVLATAAITLNLQQIVSRRIPPQAAVVVSVTHLNAQSAVNVIRKTAEISGGFRVSDPRYTPLVMELIKEISEDSANSYGVTAKVKVQTGYEATINHPQEAQLFRDVLREQFGDNYDQVDLLLPLMASEDFSYYTQKVPGAFALIGMAEEVSSDPKYHYPCHSPHYEFNDRLLETVMKLFSKIVGLEDVTSTV